MQLLSVHIFQPQIILVVKSRMCYKISFPRFGMADVKSIEFGCSYINVIIYFFKAPVFLVIPHYCFKKHVFGPYPPLFPAIVLSINYIYFIRLHITGFSQNIITFPFVVQIFPLAIAYIVHKSVLPPIPKRKTLPGSLYNHRIKDVNKTAKTEVIYLFTKPIF